MSCHDAAVMIQNRQEQKEFRRVFSTAVTTQKKSLEKVLFQIPEKFKFDVRTGTLIVSARGWPTDGAGVF
jgi:hypothetical protein